MLHVGHTGTRNQLPQAQAEALFALLKQLFEEGYGIAHSGDCTGSDAKFHEFATSLGMRTIGHIPEKSGDRAFCKYDEELLPKNYLARNRDIVHDSSLMTSCPRTMSEESGGTWYTINYSRKKSKPLYIVWPDGRITEERIQ